MHEMIIMQLSIGFEEGMEYLLHFTFCVCVCVFSIKKGKGERLST